MNLFEDIKKSAEQDIPFVIAYYGPSTTSFEYVFPNWGEIVRYVLKEAIENAIRKNRKAYWNVQTMNFGLDGATSKDLNERFDGLVMSRKPDLIILNVGKNDAYRNVETQTTEENTKAIIEKSLERNVKVVFTTSAPALRMDLNEKIAQYVDVDRKVAEYFYRETNFHFIDFFTLFPYDAISRAYTLICAEDNPVVGIVSGEIDPLHYNQYGNALVAKIILREAFNIDFDENIFLRDVLDMTVMYPRYSAGQS